MKGTSQGLVQLCAVALFSVTAAFVAAPLYAQTLDQALSQAYLSNPTLLSQRAALRQTDEGVPQALSGWRPTVSASGVLAEEYAKVSGTPSGDNTEAGFALDISQPLFRGFRTIAARDQAEYLVRAGRADLTATEQQVLFNAVTAFMNVLRDQAVLELNINNEQVLRRELEATRDRFEVGEVTRTDVAQAESRLARATADRVFAEGNLDISRADYVQVIGTPPGVLEQPQPYTILPPNLDQAKSQAADNNPTVIAALYRERAARDNVRLVTGELLPTVTLDGGYSVADNPMPGTSFSEAASIGATVTVPIYLAGAVTSRVREAKQAVSEARLVIVDAKRSAVEIATQAWETLLSSQAQVVAFEEETRSTKIALEGVQEEAQAGLRTVLDVLDAEQEYLDARVNLVTARRDVVVASYDLVAAIGALTARNLALDVPIYDPDLYYDEVRDKWWGLGDDPIVPTSD